MLLSLENKERNNVATLEYFKAELTLRGQIYEKCKCIKVAHIDKLRNLIENLQQFVYLLFGFVVTILVYCLAV